MDEKNVRGYRIPKTIPVFGSLAGSDPTNRQVTLMTRREVSSPPGEHARSRLDSTCPVLIDPRLTHAEMQIKIAKLRAAQAEVVASA